MSITDNLPPEVQTILDTLVDDDMRALAAPPSIQTTRHHYGHYMGLLCRLNDAAPLRPTPKSSAMLWGLVLVAAGADEQGVLDAIRVSF